MSAAAADGPQTLERYAAILALAERELELARDGGSKA